MPSRADIEAALEHVQAWPGLARSPQLAKFLRYIVDAKLSGNEAGIKAYAIAVDVFGRPQSFDPQSDPIVRVQARRLRAALEEYYAGEGADDAVRFYLPVGRYIPEIGGPGVVSPPESAPPVEVAAPPPPPLPVKRSILAQLDDIVLLVLLVGVALGVAVVMTQILAPRPLRLTVPQPPTVAVAEFSTVGASDTPAGVAGLAVELVTDLNLFPFVEAVYLPRLEAGSAEHVAVPFELSGIARSDNSAVQVTASLKRTTADSAVWSMTQSVGAADLPTSLDDLSRGFADQLGSLYGPLHADALQWLAANPDINGNESDYLCGLLYALYRSSADPATGDRARTCVNAVLSRNPLSASGMAIRGALLLEQTLRQSPLAADPEPIAEAKRLLQEALRLLPTSSPIWREYGVFLAETGRPGEAEAAFRSALQLNPANIDAVASYGLLLSSRGASERGAAMANDAIGRSLSTPYWYHEALAINALRAGDNEAALREATALAAGDAELGSVIATVAARRLGAQDELNRSIAQLLEVSRFRRYGILPVLRQRIADEALRDSISEALAESGIDLAALNGPY